MPTFQRSSGEHIAERVRTFDKTEIAKYRRLVEDGTGWVQVDDEAPADHEPKRPASPKRPKRSAGSAGSDQAPTQENPPPPAPPGGQPDKPEA